MRRLAVVVAVMLTGTVVTASAAISSPGASSFVAVTPCRLVDTRPSPDNVGSRVGAIGAGETFVAQVSGANGNCSIPVSATAVSMNVTAIAPSVASFLTVFPSDRPMPLAASLNWVAGQAPTPNAVTAPLSADGKASFYNLAGTVDLTVDVVGYYEPVDPAPIGPVGAVGPTGPQGPMGAGVDPANVIHVAKSGGDVTTVQAALALVSAPSATNRWVIEIAPGIYDEPGGIDLTPFTDIEGSGRDLTTITCACSGDVTDPADSTPATIRIDGANVPVEIRRLTIVSTGSANAGSTRAMGVRIVGTTVGSSVSLEHVDVAVSGGGSSNVGVYVSNAALAARSLSVTASATGFVPAIGMQLDAQAAAHLDRVEMNVTSGAGSATGLSGSGADAVVGGLSVVATGSSAVGIDLDGTAMSIVGADLTVSGSGAGGSGTGILAQSSTTLSLARAVVEVTGTNPVGISTQSDSIGSMVDSKVSATTAITTGATGLTAMAIHAGIVDGTTAGNTTCVSVVDAAYLPRTCP